ncbi:MAG: hypothetical protein JWP57_3180 [Spirosoma sp.]|nr:hypothetical protein [Spirosoma sp.]
MDKLSINMNELSNNNINPSQYVFLFLTHARQYAAMYKFCQEGPGFGSEEILDLENRGYILNLNKTGAYYLDFFVLTDAIGQDLFQQDRDQAGLEFWNAYPIYLRGTNTGETFSLINTDKKQWLADYYLRVGYSPEKHSQVMNGLDYALDKDLIDMNIRQWLDSEQWTLMLELKELEALCNR